MYCGPEIEGGYTGTCRSYRGGLFAPPCHPTPPHAGIKQHMSLDWVHALRNLKGGSKLKSFFGFTMWCTAERNKTSLQRPLCCIKMGFYSCKGPRLFIGKMLCVQKLSWDPFVVYFLWKAKEKKKRREREKATSLQGWLSKGNSFSTGLDNFTTDGKWHVPFR